MSNGFLHNIIFIILLCTQQNIKDKPQQLFGLFGFVRV